MANAARGLRSSAKCEGAWYWYGAGLVARRQVCHDESNSAFAGGLLD
jgi:hypothetical protein